MLHQTGLIVGVFFKKNFVRAFLRAVGSPYCKKYSQKKNGHAWMPAVGMTVIPTTDARTEPVTVRGDSITVFFPPAKLGYPLECLLFR